MQSEPAHTPPFHLGPGTHIEPFENVYEGMELAACGFPLGNELYRRLSTMTRSFTRGILGSIAAPSARVELITGLRLDITATAMATPSSTLGGHAGGTVFISNHSTTSGTRKDVTPF